MEKNIGKRSIEKEWRMYFMIWRRFDAKKREGEKLVDSWIDGNELTWRPNGANGGGKKRKRKRWEAGIGEGEHIKK